MSGYVATPRNDDLDHSTHLARQRAENIRDLLSMGEHPERICLRLGITMDVYEQTLRRY